MHQMLIRRRATTRVSRLLAVVALVAVVPAMFSLAASAQQSEDPQIEPFIINGQPIAIEDVPWQVQVRVAGFFSGSFCGGSVLQNNVILTAAHCLDGIGIFDKDPREFYVVAGTADLNNLGDSQWSFADEIIVHPDWDDVGPNTAASDLALVVLATPLVFDDSVQPISLATAAETAAAAGGPGQVTGWGLTEAFGDQPDTLLAGTVQVLTDGACSALVNHTPSKEICAGATEAGSNVCNGDSGGALTAVVGGTPKQLGIASWGTFGCEVDASVFSEVAAFEPWITANTPSPAIAGPPSSISGVIFDDANTNGIRDAGEALRSGAEVTLYRPDPETPAAILSGERASVTTGADGAYDFGSLTADVYKIRVRGVNGSQATRFREGSDTTVDSDFLTALQFSNPLETPRMVLGPAGLPNTDAGLAPLNVVQGIVVEDLNDNGQRDETEPAVDDALPSDFMITYAGSTIASTGTIQDDGTYQMRLPAGTFDTRFKTDRQLARNDQGDDNSDSDFSPFPNQSGQHAGPTITVGYGETVVLDALVRAAGAAPFANGDVNCDGSLDLLDALAIALYVDGDLTDQPCSNASSSTLDAVAGDLNGDASTDATDAALLLACLVEAPGAYCPTLP